MSEWISVKDRLPEKEYAKILICWSNGVVDIWNTILLHRLIEKPIENMVSVTHWQKLPDLPKEID